VGETPIDGDTAQFYYPVTNVGTVLQYNGTAWQNVTGQVIDGNLIVTGTIAANQIAANAITAGKIQASAITTDKLDANSVTAVKIQANAITADKIDAAAVTAGKIAANAVSATNIQADAITSDKITANAITSIKIITDAITSDKIAANAITAGKIAVDAVTANTIVSNAITSDKITANAVTAGKIAANAVTSGTIAAGSITTDKLAANLIISQNIQSTGATVGNFSSPGYWLQGNTGNARFGGTVSIGNDLTVGNLITASALNAGVVSINNLSNGISVSPPGELYNAPNTTVGPGATNWTGNLGSGFYRYFLMGYIFLPYLAQFGVAGATNPRVQIRFDANLILTNSNPGTTYPYFVFYRIPQVATGGNPFLTAPGPLTTIGNQQNLYGLTSFNGRIAYGVDATLPLSGWTSTTNQVVGVALLGSNVPAFEVGVYQLSNQKFSVFYS
jgi:hypothetical protein